MSDVSNYLHFVPLNNVKCYKFIFVQNVACIYTWPDEANKVNRVYEIAIVTQTTVYAPSIRCVVRRINDQQHHGAIIGGSGY